MGLDSASPNPFCADRFRHVRAIHLMAPQPRPNKVATNGDGNGRASSGMLVICEDLVAPHYEGPKAHMRRLLLSVCPSTSIVYHGRGDPSPTPGQPLGCVNVWRGLTDVPSDGRPSFTDMNFVAAVAEQILKYGTGDAKRGNRYIECGQWEQIQQPQARKVWPCWTQPSSTAKGGEQGSHHGRLCCPLRLPSLVPHSRNSSRTVSYITARSCTPLPSSIPVLFTLLMYKLSHPASRRITWIAWMHWLTSLDLWS